jgi:hypothetical protein
LDTNSTATIGQNRRTGQLKYAHENLATATTMYRDMDMGFLLEQRDAGVVERTSTLPRQTPRTTRLFRRTQACTGRHMINQFLYRQGTP